MQALRIIAMCTVAAVVYGVLHDQITARVCVEYFSVFHPHVIDSDSPTLLALVWGVLATWWVGAIFGVGLATAARVGKRPKLAATALVRPILSLFAVTAALSLVGGLLGYFLARGGAVVVAGPMAVQIDTARHARFLADLWAHSAGYATAIVGGAITCLLTWRRRIRS